MVYSTKASKVSTFVLTLLSLLPGAANFNSDENEKISQVLLHFKEYGLPLKLFNNRCLFLPLSTLDDLDILSECKGFLVGCTNRLLMQYPKIKLDCIINLDDTTIDYQQTDLSKVCKPLSSTEKSFISSLVKELKQACASSDPKYFSTWDSTDQKEMQMIESLDHIDLRAKIGVEGYFKNLLCRLTAAGKIVKRVE